MCTQQCTWTWKIPASLVCSMYSIIFLFSLPDENRSPWDPQISTAASSAGLRTGQAAGREHAASLPSLAYMRASNWALGMRSNLPDCQTILADRPLLGFSGDRPLRDQTYATRLSFSALLFWWLFARLIHATPDVCVTANHFIGFFLNFCWNSHTKKRPLRF